MTTWYTGKYRDFDGLNEKRADQAQTAVEAFAEIDDPNDPLETSARYMLCNLLHLAYREDWDVKAMLSSAAGMFHQECNLDVKL